ncbi:uncharacterized protein CG3556 isoform X2 [Camponotus floridanus]|uniref:uncharacterized protein CG3556 isoform X2 n=1 Tax=Camponotus floridanus TaxID=104421 RepID=UPI00059C8A88|nr:uncharacterized protein CG3556 isoform X2 [Camponotus floridanus]
MWGRANMIVILFLGWLYIFARAEGNVEMTFADVEAETILERAATWLWSQRDKDAGWGNDTHRVLLVLRLANLSRDDNVTPSAPPLELQLTAKQMELEIVLLLWRHREVGFSPVRLAHYTLAMNAMCMDPRQFYGHDLIGTLQHHEPPTDYEFTLTALAACSAQAHVRKRQMRRLLDIASTPQNYNIDTIAMLILVLRCISQDHRHRNIHHIIRKPSTVLVQQQRHDGSFGDLHTTALVMQALEEVENEPADNWNRSAALAWLISQQRPDGSFHGDVRATAEAILSVTPRGLANIRTLDCGQSLSDNSPPRLTKSNIEDIGTSDNHSETTLPSEALGNNVSNADTTVAYTSTPVLVNVSYTLWVGSNVNETYNLTVTAPKNETFYDVMLLAAEMSPHFEFLASDWPNGHYVHTIAGYKEEPMSYHYWLLYRLPSPPEPSSPPGNQLVAPGGVDNLQISEGEHYLFWYKKL